MKIFVTGGAGFIASNFVCRAIEVGHEVVNVDKLTYAGNLKNIETCSTHPNYQFHQIDICDQKTIDQLIMKTQPDVILHTAAETHVDRSIDSSDVFIETNINGTYSLLKAALNYYKKIEDKQKFCFIHLSTDEVFGALGPTGQFDEASPYKPNSPYAASKASSDLLVRSYFQTFKLPCIVVNASNNYGPHQYPEKIIPVTLLNALNKTSLPIYGDGKQVRDWLFVEDHVDALFSIINSGHVGESYCIGADNEMCNVDLVNLICKTLDDLRPTNKSYKDLITFVTDRPGHDFRYSVNANKLKQDTGWEPKTAIEDGILKTVKWYLSQYDAQSYSNYTSKRLGVGK